MKGMPAQFPALEAGRLEPESHEPRLHLRPAWQYTAHRPRVTVLVLQLIEKVEHPTALGEQGLVRSHVGSQTVLHARVIRERLEVQLWITAREVYAVDRGQRGISER
jgi:hypothetical protein